MKASDVMIGDWVYDTHSYNYNKKKEPVKLDRNEFAELICGCTGNNDLDLGDMYEPIPLTEEILKANGFEFKSDSCMHYDHYIDVYLNKDGDIFMLIGGHQRWIKYIHEFQHALRLSGLDELANNFKV